MSLANFSDPLILAAQAYVVAFHSGGVFVHWCVGHHPVAGVAPGFFVVVAFSIGVLRTNVFTALVGTLVFAAVGTILGFLMVRPKQSDALLRDADQ